MVKCIFCGIYAHQGVKTRHKFLKSTRASCLKEKKRERKPELGHWLKYLNHWGAWMSKQQQMESDLSGHRELDSVSYQNVHFGRVCQACVLTPSLPLPFHSFPVILGIPSLICFSYLFLCSPFSILHTVRKTYNSLYTEMPFYYWNHMPTNPYVYIQQTHTCTVCLLL